MKSSPEHADQPLFACVSCCLPFSYFDHATWHPGAHVGPRQHVHHTSVPLDAQIKNLCTQGCQMILPGLRRSGWSCCSKPDEEHQARQKRPHAMRVPKDNQISKPPQELADEWAGIGPLLTVFGRRAQLHPGHPHAAEARQSLTTVEAVEDEFVDPAEEVVLAQHGDPLPSAHAAMPPAAHQQDLPDMTSPRGAADPWADDQPAPSTMVRCLLACCCARAPYAAHAASP